MTLTDKRLATLARVLGGGALACKDGVWWREDYFYNRIGSDWDLIGALLLKLAEMKVDFAIYSGMIEFGNFNDAMTDYHWTTPTDLLCAIADACEVVNKGETRG